MWLQSESDAATPELAAAWPAAFGALVTALRADLARPGLPILMAAIGDPPLTGRYAARFPGWRTVQSAQRDFTLPGVHVVAAAGLPRNEDQLHLSTAGEIELGRRLAEIWAHVE